MDKLKLAHDWAMKSFVVNGFKDEEERSVHAWKYADAMQAEAEKRKKAEAAQKRKEIREMLSADNTFVEREGQHFDDVCSDEIQAQRDAELYGTGFLKVTYDSDGVKYERLNPKAISICSSNIGLDSQVLKEWQPDWSKAPDGYNWFCVGSNDGYGFFSNQAPELFKDYYFVGADGFVVNNHGYQGNWQDSLRKRPQ